MDKREKILETTASLLAERGFYGLSMKVLAQKAGIAAGTIYCYFENKEMLMVELHRYICIKSSEAILKGWSNEQTAKQKHTLLWHNAFNVVIANPQLSIVMDMLYSMPDIHKNNINIFEENAFEPLCAFYQQGIDAEEFHDWPIVALMSLSFYSAISLAKKTVQGLLVIDESILAQVRDASWQAIQKQHY